MPAARVYFKDHINTDEIIPARYLITFEEAELAKHAMEDLDPDFVRRVRPGDVLLAGADFGCGSSREHAVWALRGAGIAAVLAPSFARIFYRNAINGGFPVFEADGLEQVFAEGDEVQLDTEHGLLRRRAGGQVQFRPLPEFAKRIAQAGGLLEYFRDQARG